jgi:hypothetical protein
MPRMLDIYSGLGGASEAFVQAGWEVHRLENNVLLKDVPQTQMVDVLSWPFEELPSGYYDFIWASPDCTDFSNGYNAPGPKAKREGREFSPDLSLVLKAKEIIDYFQPPWWVIENVAGGRKIISKTLGAPPWQILGPFFLWGKFPFIQMEYDWTHSKNDGEKWSTDPLRSNHRAKVPLEISTAFLKAVSSQTKITEW